MTARRAARARRRARRPRAARRELRRRRAQPATSARAGARGACPVHDRRRAPRRARGRAGRGAVHVAARAVVHRVRSARPVPPRPGARGHRRRPALARSGRLRAGARPRARRRRRAAHAHRRARAPERAGRPDVPAPRQPGGARVLGLEEPRPGLRGRRRAPRRPRGDPGHGGAARGPRVGRDRGALARAPAGGVRGVSRPRLRAGRLPGAAARCTRPARTTSRGDPGARAMWAHAQRHAPARPGDEVLAGRFFDGSRRLPGAVAVVQRGDHAFHAGVAQAAAAGVVLHRLRRP